MLASRNVSLLCALINIAFAINSFLNGDIVFGIICSGIATICLYNSRDWNP